MMHTNLSMRVKMRPQDLIKALEVNKADHLEEYASAVQDYFAEARRQLNALQRKVRAGDLDGELRFMLVKPVNIEGLYDKYIGMFRMTTDEEIEISAEDYGCIVDNNWDWATSAKATNALYSSARR